MGIIIVLIRKRLWAAIVLCFCCLICASSLLAQGSPKMPTTEGDSFAGHKVVLPDAAAGKVAVLIFGFTKASKIPTGAWADKLLADFGTRPGVELYQLPVLEEVPRLFRGMVISGIRKGVAENKRDHFVPILQGEAELKKLVHYQEPDDAYLVLLSRGGNIVQQIHGTPTEAKYSQVRSAIESLLNQK